MRQPSGYDPAARRDTPLARVLATRIRRHGPMSVSDYMQACLWDPDHGYYRREAVIGRAGDFTTAPEISQVFGELVGLWVAVVWQQMGAPGRIQFVELGPGRGTLMADALRAVRVMPALRTALRVHLIEESVPLRTRQAAALADSGVPVTFGSTFEPLPNAPTIVIGNEFLDALPIAQFVKTEVGWCRRGVGLDAEGRLGFVALAPAEPAWIDAERLSSLPPSSICEEFAGAFDDVFGALASVVPCAMLLIDYGHDESAPGETLQAVRSHAYEHPLTSPGEADLSAHVDFASFAVKARSSGLAVDGPVPQGQFLGALGAVERASVLMAQNPSRANAIETGVARLIDPRSMGGRFRAIGLRSPALPPLPGLVASDAALRAAR